MRNFLQFLVTLLTIGAMAWIAWQGYRLLAGKGETLTEVQRSLVVMVGLLVLICTFVLNGAVRSVGLARTRVPLYRQRTVLYENFLVLWQRTRREVAGRGGTHLELDADEILAQMALYASTEVLVATRELLSRAAAAGIEECTPQWEYLLHCMRLDIGNQNTYGLRAELPAWHDLLTKNHAS